VPARRCSACDKNWEPGQGRVHCPLCGAALSFQSHLKGKDGWPGTIPQVLPELTPEQAAEIREGWGAVRAEAERRRGTFSMADIIGEGDPRTLK